MRDSRAGHFIPVRSGLGIWPDYKMSVCRRQRRLEIQVDKQAGELSLALVPMEFGPGGSSGRFGTGFLPTFHMGRVVWPGEPFSKETQKFKKPQSQAWTCPNNQQMLISQEKEQTPEAECRVAAGSFSEYC